MILYLPQEGETIMGIKRKVLCWQDFCGGSTGFGNVSRAILQRLQATGNYEFDIVAINYDGSYVDQNKYPYHFYPAVSPLSTNEKMKSDVYGFQKVLLMAGSGKYDLIFIINDPFIIKVVMPQLVEMQKKMAKDKRFEIITYFPVDCQLKPEWVKDTISNITFPVAYTKYARSETIKHDPSQENIQIIYHGVDKNIFFPYPKEELAKLKMQMFGPDHHNKYVVLNVARNQPRKDLLRTFKGFKIFHDKYPNTFLFLLSQAQDVGGNLIEIANKCGLVWDKDWACPAPGSYGANQGYPIEIVNKIYNASDVVVSTALAEGFGLSTVEGMATMKPLLFPKNTSLVEIIGENEERGWFIESGKDENFWVCLGNGDNNNIRPVVDVYDMADKLEYIYTHPDEVRAKVERAYSEVWTWDEVCKEWITLFDKAWNKVQVMRTPHPEIGRNEPCPCNSGKKYKVCCM